MRDLTHSTATALPPAAPLTLDGSEPSEPDWWDEYTGGDNLNRMLAGKQLHLGDNEAGIPESVYTIREVVGVTVGIDSKGMFAAIRVTNFSGVELLLYADGTVHDADTDDIVGTHSFKKVH